MEKSAMLIMKSGKRHMTDRMEQQNQEKIRKYGEKKNYKYLGILEADTIKQVEMKDKIKKTNTIVRESYSKPNYIAYDAIYRPLRSGKI